jgi:hypothetical protein
MMKVATSNVAMFLGGALVAMIAAPLLLYSAGTLLDWYDAANPIATVRVASLERVEPDAVRLRMFVTRQRDCDTLRMVATTGTTLSDMQLATRVQREDGQPPLSYPIGVTLHSPPWLISPVYGPRLMFWGYYDCGQRVVKQLLVDTVIP